MLAVSSRLILVWFVCVIVVTTAPFVFANSEMFPALRCKGSTTVMIKSLLSISDSIFCSLCRLVDCFTTRDGAGVSARVPLSWPALPPHSPCRCPLNTSRYSCRIASRL